MDISNKPLNLCVTFAFVPSGERQRSHKDVCLNTKMNQQSILPWKNKTADHLNSDLQSIIFQPAQMSTENSILIILSFCKLDRCHTRFAYKTADQHLHSTVKRICSWPCTLSRESIMLWARAWQNKCVLHIKEHGRNPDLQHSAIKEYCLVLRWVCLPVQGALYVKIGLYIDLAPTFEWHIGGMIRL